MRISAEKVDVSCILRLEKESFWCSVSLKGNSVLAKHKTEMWLHRDQSTKSMPSYQVCLGQ